MRKTQIILLQKALRETVAPEIVVDGLWGSNSVKALNKYASANGVSVSNGEALLNDYIKARFATDEAYAQAAAKLKVPEHYVRAVAEVETNGSSFLADGRMKILFERHWFYKKLKEALAKAPVQKHVESILGKGPVDARIVADILFVEVTKKYSDICNAKSGGYLGGAAEWDRLDKAMSIDIEAACQSASYGGFQLMGFNHMFCGYPTAKAMMLDLAGSESKQLMAVVTFILSQPSMLKALRAGDWPTFAKWYNGPNYAINKYDIKLAKAESKWHAELA